jgi:hypothetical protein
VATHAPPPLLTLEHRYSRVYVVRVCCRAQRVAPSASPPPLPPSPASPPPSAPAPSDCDRAVYWDLEDSCRLNMYRANLGGHGPHTDWADEMRYGNVGTYPINGHGAGGACESWCLAPAVQADAYALCSWTQCARGIGTQCKSRVDTLLTLTSMRLTLCAVPGKGCSLCTAERPLDLVLTLHNGSIFVPHPDYAPGGCTQVRTRRQGARTPLTPCAQCASCQAVALVGTCSGVAPRPCLFVTEWQVRQSRHPRRFCGRHAFHVP